MISKLQMAAPAANLGFSQGSHWGILAEAKIGG
jgi:hypothetical protein